MNDPPRRGTMRSRAATHYAASTQRLKFLFVGDAGVGKTMWLKRARHEATLATAAEAEANRRSSNPRPSTVSMTAADAQLTFDARQTDATIGVDFTTGPVTLRGGVRIQPNLFDLSGALSYTKVRAEFYSDLHGLVLCFDLTSRPSFEHLDSWWKEMLEVRGGDATSAPSHVLVLGLKSDVEKRPNIPERDLKAWCRSHGATYFESSAKTGDGVLKAWQYLIEHAQASASTPQQPLPAQQQQQQQQRPPSASPSHSPSPSPSPSASSSNSGATNISELSLPELRRECAKRNVIGADDSSLTQAELLQRLREHLARERASKADAASSAARAADQMRESVLDDVARWAAGKDVRAMLNEILGYTRSASGGGESNYLDKSSNFAAIEKAYKKAVVKIHPDKVSTSVDGGAAHLRATEMFKTVNAAFETARKAHEKRASYSADVASQPSSSPHHSPTGSPTPRQQQAHRASGVPRGRG